jgi:hypothetical protein
MTLLTVLLLDFSKVLLLLFACPLKHLLADLDVECKEYAGNIAASFCIGRPELDDAVSRYYKFQGFLC